MWCQPELYSHLWRSLHHDNFSELSSHSQQKTRDDRKHVRNFIDADFCHWGGTSTLFLNCTPSTNADICSCYYVHLRETLNISTANDSTFTVFTGNHWALTLDTDFCFCIVESSDPSDQPVGQVVTSEAIPSQSKYKGLVNYYP